MFREFYYKRSAYFSSFLLTLDACNKKVFKISRLYVKHNGYFYSTRVSPTIVFEWIKYFFCFTLHRKNSQIVIVIE